MIKNMPKNLWKQKQHGVRCITESRNKTHGRQYHLGWSQCWEYLFPLIQAAESGDLELFKREHKRTLGEEAFHFAYGKKSKDSKAAKRAFGFNN